MKKKAINIENISCANCISKISRILIRKGVHSVKGNTLLKKILIKYNDSKISSNNIKQALKDNGFLFKISKKLYKRLLIYSIMVYIIFLLSNYLYNNIYIAFVISTINMVIILYNLRHKFYNLLDELMLIGSISSYFLGIVSYLFESDELYEDYSTSITFFDVSMLIIIFLLVKECILENIQNRQLKFINKLENGDFKKTVTKKIIDANEIEVDIDKIMVGDIILLEKNDVVFVDGHIIEGEAFIDQSNITGESYPENVKEKDKILSGSKILSGKIKIKVENTGENSLIGKFLSNIKTATYQKSDEFSNFHKIIFFISILASLFYMILGLLNIKPYALYVSDYIIISSLKVGLTILTVSCPCALIISKPLLLLGTIKKLAKDGIIIRNYNSLLINSIDIIFLDKTGTITDFNAKSIKFKILKNPIITKKELFNILNVLEKEEKHPIANIIYNYTLKHITKDSITIQDKKFYSGKGLEANIILNNITYNIKIDNKDYISTKENTIKEIINKNKKIYISINNKIEYIIYIKEKIHNNILTTINKIKKNNIEIILISGDSKENTKPIAKKLNIKYFSNKSAEDKFTTIKKYITDKNNYIIEKNKYMKYNDNSFISNNYNNYNNTYQYISRNVYTIIKYIIFNIYTYYSNKYNKLYKNNNSINSIMIGDGYNDILAMKETTTSISINNLHSTSDIIIINNKTNNNINIDYIIKYINSIKDINNKYNNIIYYFYIYNIISILIAIGILLPYNIYINIKISIVCMFISFIIILYNSYII